LGGIGFFGPEDDAVFEAEGVGGGGEPVSGFIESAGEDGWGGVAREADRLPIADFILSSRNK
jgi:hypothetical protein